MRMRASDYANVNALALYPVGVGSYWLGIFPTIRPHSFDIMIRHLRNCYQ